jgi:hypothetical protein
MLRVSCSIIWEGLSVFSRQFQQEKFIKTGFNKFLPATCTGYIVRRRVFNGDRFFAAGLFE